MKDIGDKEFRRSTRQLPSRRRLLEVLGATAAGSGCGLLALPARKLLAQDTPVDCSPIGVSGKTPVTFQPQAALPVRVRKSAFELSAPEVDRLKSAYAALRKLTTDSADDPRGWLRQGYVHCWYCGGGSSGDAASEDIHGGWHFFPWHRAFLYFHERILCKLIGDDTFALPYWDWDSEGRQTFPAVYGDPNDPSNPLSDMLRSARPGDAIDPGVVSAPIMNPTMNAPTNNLFMGSQNDSGALENQPHGPVHIWTADTTSQAANNDMGVLDTAAQDPVFFAHHGNIDRLWSVWLGLAPTHRNFTSPTWLTHVWQFYDENSVWTQIAISDVIDMENSLRVSYQPPSVNPIWTFVPRPAVVALVPGSGPFAADAQAALLVANAPEGIPLGTAPVTRSISLPPLSASAFSTLTPASAPSYVLHIEGIEVPADRQAYFRVYLNLPGANAGTKVESPNYVGTVTVLAKSKSPHAHQHAGVNAAFDITEALARVAKAAGTNLSVTLVPVAAGGPQVTAPAAAAAGAASATFKRIYIDRI
jgi:polyphenol oxidase